MVMAITLILGFTRASARTIGNFWVDITRCTLYILLPICIPYALFLVWQGIPQTLGPYVEATTLEGAKQTIAVGPVASQIAIKMLGAMVAASSTPTPLTRLKIRPHCRISCRWPQSSRSWQPSRMCLAAWSATNARGWAILAAVGTLFIAGVVVCYSAEAPAHRKSMGWD